MRQNREVHLAWERSHTGTGDEAEPATNRRREVKSGQHFRTLIATEQVADDGWSNRRVARLHSGERQ